MLPRQHTEQGLTGCAFVARNAPAMHRIVTWSHRCSSAASAHGQPIAPPTTATLAVRAEVIGNTVKHGSVAGNSGTPTEAARLISRSRSAFPDRPSLGLRLWRLLLFASLHVRLQSVVRPLTGRTLYSRRRSPLLRYFASAPRSCGSRNSDRTGRRGPAVGRYDRGTERCLLRPLVGCDTTSSLFAGTSPRPSVNRLGVVAYRRADGTDGRHLGVQSQVLIVCTTTRTRSRLTL